MSQGDMLLEQFGRFGLLAQRVATKSFQVQMLNQDLVSTTSIRMPTELLARIEALAAVGGVSRNRLLCELLQESTDELENSLQTENPSGFSDYIHTYESLCELSMDARD